MHSCSFILVNCRLKVDHLLVGGHNLLQLLNVGASQVGYLGLVLEEDEGRHGGDLMLRSHVLTVINVDLQDDHVAHGLGNLLEVGGNHLAWSTPGSEKIHYNQLASCSFQLGIKVSKIFDSINHPAQGYDQSLL